MRKPECACGHLETEHQASARPPGRANQTRHCTLCPCLDFFLAGFRLRKGNVRPRKDTKVVHFLESTNFLAETKYGLACPELTGAVTTNLARVNCRNCLLSEVVRQINSNNTRTERDKLVAQLHAHLDQAWAECDQARAERDQARAECDQARAERDQARAERDQAWRDFRVDGIEVHVIDEEILLYSSPGRVAVGPLTDRCLVAYFDWREQSGLYDYRPTGGTWGYSVQFARASEMYEQLADDFRLILAAAETT